MIHGLDLLGGARYQRVARSALPRGFAFGVFWNVDGFGPAAKLIEAVAKSGKAPAIRVQLDWSDTHSFPRKRFAEIGKRAKELQKIAAKYPNIGWYVSGACEHNLNAKDAQELANIVKAACPAARYVNSVWKGAILKGEINEIHGDRPAKPGTPYIVSYDGTSMEDKDVESWKRRYSDALIQFGWSNRFNGNADKGRKPRPQRDAWPDKNYIRSIVRLLEPKGDAPPCAKGKPLRKPSLLKSHAEDHGKGDAKANKLLFILPGSASSAEIRTCDGKLVEKLPRFGSYDGGGSRYYSRQYGFQVGARARKLSGSEWVLVKAGKEVYGPFNPAFRTPYYQS